MNEEYSMDLLCDISDKPVIIYGAHLVAMETARYLKEMGCGAGLLGFAVTDTEGNPSCLEGLQVRPIAAYAKVSDTAVIIIAVPLKYHKEIEETCRALGFNRFWRISLEELSLIKGRRLVEENASLRESHYDPTWLDLHIKDVYCKFPTLYYRTKEDVWAETKSWLDTHAYDAICVMGKNVHKLLLDDRCEPAEELQERAVGGNVTESEALQPVMQIYMAFGEGEIERVKAMELPVWTVPMQVGCRWAKKRYGECFDDEGDSIAEYNRNLAEMTAAYAVWKKQSGAVYKGLCHYRRHYVITGQEIKRMQSEGIDVLLTIPRYAPYGIKNMFLAETPVKEPVYEMMLQAIKECHPEDEAEFAAYMEDCLYYPNNMVVAKAEIYDSYCEWIFPVLMRMSELDKETGYGHESDRHVAYAAELLTSFYFVKNRAKYRVAVTEYRFEG